MLLQARAGGSAQEESKPGADEQAAAAADVSWMDDVEAFFGGGILGDAGGLGVGLKEEQQPADVKMVGSCGCLSCCFARCTFCCPDAWLMTPAVASSCTGGVDVSAVLLL